MKTNNQAKPKASEVHYWLYSTGNFANNIIFMMVGTYITYFYTNILGISPAMAGLVFMVARLVDAFTDPLMGIIVDKLIRKSVNTDLGLSQEHHSLELCLYYFSQHRISR